MKWGAENAALLSAELSALISSRGSYFEIHANEADLIPVESSCLIVPNLGAAASNMGFKRASFDSALFTETQQRLLGYLFVQPQRSFYAKELIKLTASGSGAIQRELKRLETSRLIIAHWQGNQKHYQANPDAPIYEELCNIAEKTFGLADPIREWLEPFADEIHAAFIYGSVAKQSEHAFSDIDVMVISKPLSYAQLMGALEPAEQRLGRRVYPTLYTRKDFQQRPVQFDSFLTRYTAKQDLARWQ